MSITYNNPGVRKLTPMDDDFCIVSGHAYYPRAVITFGQGCPDEVKKIVQLAITKNWISTEAWMSDKEYMWEKLSK